METTSEPIQLSDLHWVQVYDFFIEQCQTRLNELIKDSAEINKCINEQHALMSSIQAKKAQKEEIIKNKQINKE